MYKLSLFYTLKKNYLHSLSILCQALEGKTLKKSFNLKDSDKFFSLLRPPPSLPTHTKKRGGGVVTLTNFYVISKCYGFFIVYKFYLVMKTTKNFTMKNFAFYLENIMH